MFTSPLHDKKVNMWCGIMNTFILDLYFFEEVTDSDLQTCAATRAHYLDMFTHYAIPKWQWQNALSEFMWMEDGTPPHVGSSVKRLLSQQFDDRLVSHYFPFLWPPRSPDLTPMDFWLWRYVKSKVHHFHL